MPIKPIYCERILSGEKKFEFRRTSVRADVSHLIVYSSFPVKKIVAIAEVTSIITASPSAIWEKTKKAAGITRKLFREYFRGSKKACAIEIGNIEPLHLPIHPEKISPEFNVPQSFSYVDRAFLEQVAQIGSAECQASNKEGILVFVGGIHGVGKSTLCSSATCQEVGFVHLTASDLIRKASSGASPWVDKKVSDIGENQEVLANVLSELRHKDKKYVLDGHFTLLDGMGNFQDIPLATFKAIHPDRLIVITELPKIVAQRLKNRDEQNYDEKLLSEMQNAEILHAQRIGKALKIPVQIISHSSQEEFISILEKG